MKSQPTLSPPCCAGCARPQLARSITSLASFRETLEIDCDHLAPPRWLASTALAWPRWLCCRLRCPAMLQTCLIHHSFQTPLSSTSIKGKESRPPWSRKPGLRWRRGFSSPAATGSHWGGLRARQFAFTRPLLQSAPGQTGERTALVSRYALHLVVKIGGDA